MTTEEKAVSDAAAKVMLATKELERTIEAGKFQFSTYYSRQGFAELAEIIAYGITGTAMPKRKEKE